MNIQQNQYSLLAMDPEKVDLLKRTICKGATNEELELFIHACNRTQLDPFMRQIYAIKRKSRTADGNWTEAMTIQTGIDGYRLIAERTGRYMPGKECTFTYQEKKVFSATGYVKKLASDGQWHEIGHTVYWSEYVPLNRDGQPTGMWKDKPHVMLGKCAESGVLRKAFPADLSGVYTKEEMEQADVDLFPVVASKSVEEKKKDFVDANMYITEEEALNILKEIGENDEEYKKNLLNFFTKKLNLESSMKDFSLLPKKYLNDLMVKINQRKFNRIEAAKKTKETEENEVQF